MQGVVKSMAKYAYLIARKRYGSCRNTSCRRGFASGKGIRWSAAKPTAAASAALMKLRYAMNPLTAGLLPGLAHQSRGECRERCRRMRQRDFFHAGSAEWPRPPALQRAPCLVSPATPRIPDLCGTRFPGLG